MSDTARQRRVSFGEAALLPQATSATASGPPLSNVLEEAFAEAAASSAGSADSLPVDELGGLLANMGLMDASDAGTFMQQQRVLAAGAPSAKRGDFAQLVNALDEWRQAVPQVVESGARLDASLVAKLEVCIPPCHRAWERRVAREGSARCLARSGSFQARSVDPRARCRACGSLSSRGWTSMETAR